MTKLVSTFKSASAASSVSVATSVIGGGGALLLHFDGTNGSTTFTDFYGHTFTGHGNAQLSTAQAKFGTSSLSSSDAANFGSGWISTPFATGLKLTGDWTAECFVYMTNFTNACGLFNNANATTNGVNVFNNGSSQLNVQVADSTGSSFTINSTSGGGSFTSATWHHIALVNHGGACVLYIDGVSKVTGTLTGDPAGSNAWNIGTRSNGGLADLDSTMWIDEFRLSTVARYTAGFTPPSSPFTS
jgi:hypothetical protein